MRSLQPVPDQHATLQQVLAEQLHTPTEAVTTTSFDDVFGVNVRGTLLTVQKAVPLMTAGGSVIINGAAGAVKGVPGAGVYSASKAALRSFTRTWTAELAGRGIRVNLISPGPIDTATFDGIPDEFRAGIAAMVPAARFGTSEEIAAAVLSSPARTPASSTAASWPSMAVLSGQAQHAGL